MLACKRYVFGDRELEDVANYSNVGLKMQKILDPIHNFMYVTSQSKYDVEKNGYNFDEIIRKAESNLNGKIHYVKISDAVKENAVILKRGLKKFYRSGDTIFAYCVTNNCIMVTSDDEIKECCNKVGCQCLLITSNSELITK